MSKTPHPAKTSTKRPALTGTPAPPVAGVPRSLLEDPVLHLLLLAVVGLVAYSNTFHVPFVFDDNSSILDNPVVKDLPAFLSGGGYAYNPRRFIGYLSFALNYRLGGLDVTGYHIFNLAIHIFTAWLVYFLVRLTLRTPFFSDRGQDFTTQNTKLKTQNFLPLLAALLFVAHPVQTQAVTYIVQRLASLATLFYLASLVFYIKARLALGDSEALETQNSKLFRPAVWVKTQNLKYLSFFALSLIAALAAMRTKEIAATLPVVVLLYEFSFFGAGARKKLLFLVPLLLTVLIIPLGMLHTGKPLGELLSDVSEMTRESHAISRGEYLLTQFSVIVTYIRLLFFPVNQNLDYDYPVYDSLFNPRVFFSFLFLAGLLSLAVYLYYRSSQCKIKNAKCKTQNENNPSNFLFFIFHFSFFTPGAVRLIAFGILWFFITLAVESSVIPITDVIFEHRLYLPSVGAFVSLAALAVLVFRKHSQRRIMTGAITLATVLAALTWQRNITWQDPVDLWTDVSHKSPKKDRAYSNLGFAFNKEGKADEAIRYLNIALTLNPNNAKSHNTMGSAYQKKGLKELAMQQFLTATQLDPALADAHSNLGAAYGERGLIDQAIEQLEISVKLNACAANTLSNLGSACAIKGLTDKAIGHFQAAIALDPDSPDLHLNLANVYAAKGWTDRAAEELNIAVSLKN